MKYKCKANKSKYYTCIPLNPTYLLNYCVKFQYLC